MSGGDDGDNNLKTKLLDVNASEEVFEEGGMGLEDGGTDGESFDTLTLTTNSNTAKDRISLVKSEECQAHLNYLPFWRKPVARQYWVKTDYGFVSSLSINKENRAATPADLVFDLVFVVLLNRLGRALRAELNNDCGSASLRQECGDFAWSIALNRFVLILMSSYAVYHNWQYKNQFLSYIIPDILVTLLWILVGEECPINSCWTPFIVFWWSAIFVDFFKALMPLWWFRLKLIKCRTELMAFNLPLLVERYELFVIISIGEVVAASLASESVSSEGAEDDDHHRFLEDGDAINFDKDTYLLVALIVLEAALIKLAYFDVAEHPCPTGKNRSKRRHALARNAKTGVAWVMLYLPLNAAIVIFGSIMEPLKLHGEFSQVTANSLSFCLGIIVVIIALFDILHGGGGSQRRAVSKQSRTVFKAALVIIFAALPFATDWNKSPLGFVACCNVVTLIEVAFTFYSFRPMSDKQKPKKREGIESLLRGDSGSTD
ncbi:hypothetical protein TrCOL_g7526 [Triparma columacea]|uniref:Transmembrane protein n=1 Tax=Triparma columacea TaxID=722753 RepID=A0A9W7G8F8_9STRA|nr:hypothetical protein TrCOL_g7526 [Triparma columacea]